MLDDSNNPSIAIQFQAIADIQTGHCVGYEVIDAEAQAGWADVDRAIEFRRLLGETLVGRPEVKGALMFLPLPIALADHIDKIHESSDTALAPYLGGVVTQIAGAKSDTQTADLMIQKLHRQRGMVCLERFGESFESIGYLFHCDLDFLKIPNFVIEATDRSPRQKIILKQLITTAHTFGVKVIATGVAHPSLLDACRSLGCDMAQGDLIEPKLNDLTTGQQQFQFLADNPYAKMRRRTDDMGWVVDHLNEITPVSVDIPMQQLFDYVASNPTQKILPVVDQVGYALGILREESLRNHAYSAYGKALLANRSLGLSVRSFLERCPIVAIGTPLDHLMAIFSIDGDTDGILVTEGNIYRGFLDAKAIVRAIHERSLARAADENPLTKLPGNKVISEFIANALARPDPVALVYLDFDNFKPFNDRYGFRQGDRVILMFGDMLKRIGDQRGVFVGHIGGDDFFAGLLERSEEEITEIVTGLISEFAYSAMSFYDEDIRSKGYMLGKDRFGEERRFELLTVSAVVLMIEAPDGGYSTDDISSAIALYKKTAKTSKGRCAVVKI